MTTRVSFPSPESGNALLIILLAIVLMGLLTAAIQMTSAPQGAGIDQETLILEASRVREYMSELERAVHMVMQNGHSESDLRFAHPDAHADYGTIGTDTPVTRQIFHTRGGGATYRKPPSGVQNAPAAWEFYGGTHLPHVGTSRPDLIAVLPDVTKAFCDHLNKINGFSTTTQPNDTGTTAAGGASPGDCLHGGASVRFRAARQFYTAPNINTLDSATFIDEATNTATTRPVIQGCTRCALDSKYHAFHVLMAR